MRSITLGRCTISESSTPRDGSTAARDVAALRGLQRRRRAPVSAAGGWRGSTPSVPTLGQVVRGSWPSVIATKPPIRTTSASRRAARRVDDLGLEARHAAALGHLALQLEPEPLELA